MSAFTRSGNCRRYPCFAWLLIVFVVGFGTTQPAFAATFYVAPNGNDGNPGTETRPFQTLERARTAVRAVNGNMTEDVTVYLRGGEYSLAAPFVLDQADSGKNGFNVVWRAYANEKPVISGGQQISGWKSVGGGIWKAPVGTLRFRQLYVNGSRAVRARTPNVGSYYTLTNYDEGGRRLQIPANTIANWQNFNQVEVNLLGKGVVNAYLRLSSFSVSGGSAFVTPQEPERTRLFIRSYPTKEAGRPYYFENVFEFLDSPDEWYLNTSTNEVFYIPRAGENMASVSIVAPRLENIVRIQGTLSNPAHHIQFHGLAFEHTTWTIPSTDGYVGDQGGLAATGAILNDEITYYEGHRPPAGIHMEAADNIRLERNMFRHFGGAGINLYVGNHNNVIIGNVIEDVSNNGIALDMNLEGNPTDTRKVSKNNTVSNNYIHDIGKDYYSSIGILAGYTNGSVIEHNEVHDTPYTGISVGWGWDDVANAARNNLVRNNKVFNVIDTMADGGGIYTLSRQPGTIIHENHVHDIFRTSIHGGYVMPGIYLDEGSNLITVRDNVIQNVDGQNGSGAIFQNANGPSNTFSNNSAASPTVVANAGLEPAYWDIRPAPVPPPFGSLIVAYSCDESSGTTAVDSSGNGRTATLLNGPTWTLGKYGNAIGFDGIDDYVAASNLNLPTGDYTYEAWVALDRNNIFQTIMEALDGVGGAELELDLAAGGAVQLWSNNGQRLTTGTAIPVGTWSHVALTRQGSTIRVYLNGVLQSQTGSDSGTLDFSNCPLLIGVDADSACTGLLNGYLDGRIDEVRIYNRALSQAEIQTDMNAPIRGVLEAPTGLRVVQ
ncbi:MAG: LamG-like jellyroll fold domain-containing protein [Nitrososphaera sp.]